MNHSSHSSAKIGYQLIPFWKVETNAGLIFACAMTIVLGIAHEFLGYLKGCIANACEVTAEEIQLVGDRSPVPPQEGYGATEERKQYGVRDRRSRRRVTGQDDLTQRSERWLRFVTCCDVMVQSILYATQAGVRFTLMAVFMALDLYLCLSTVVGMFVGYLTFHGILRGGKSRRHSVST